MVGCGARCCQTFLERSRTGGSLSRSVPGTVSGRGRRSGTRELGKGREEDAYGSFGSWAAAGGTHQR